MTIWQVQIEALQPISIARQISSQADWATTHYIPGSTWRGAVAEQWKYVCGFDHPQTEDFITACIFHDAHETQVCFTPVYFKHEKKSYNAVNVLTHYLQHGEFLATHNEQALLDSTPYTANVVETTAMGIQMSRTRESTEQGRLYTMTSIAEGTTFYTTASIPEQLLQLIAPNKELTVYIGKKRFSGYGKARITFTKKTAVDDVRERFLAWQSFSNGQLTVVLTAKSPTILYDAYLRPAKNVEWAQHVKHVLPTHLQHLQPVQEETWAMGAVRNGWQQAWNAPKPTESVLLPGATYIARFEAEQEEVVEALAFLEQQGIGERLQEGFGEWVVAPIERSEQVATVIQQAVQTKEQFTSEEEAAILAEAYALVGILQRIDRKSGKHIPLIPLSQWQMLISAQNPIEEITSTHEMAYIEKRIKTKVRNVWRTKALKGELCGYVLRKKVEQLTKQYEKRADAAVRLLLQFSARYVRMQTKGESLYDR